MMVRNFLRICRIVVALLATTVAVAGNAADTSFGADKERSAGDNARADTRQQIAKFMKGYVRELAKRLGDGTRVEYEAAAITDTSATRPCAAPLNIGAQNQQAVGRVTLLVACDSEWSIYVPVDLNILRPVVVTTRPLATGAVIAADDIALAPQEIGALNGTYLTALDEAIGMGVKRPLLPGKPIFTQQLEQPLLIRRGEAVVISAAAGEFSVSTSGTALSDGRRGDMIRIKNSNSARTVSARVIGPGQVTVAM